MHVCVHVCEYTRWEGRLTQVSPCSSNLFCSKSGVQEKGGEGWVRRMIMEQTRHIVRVTASITLAGDQLQPSGSQYYCCNTCNLGVSTCLQTANPSPPTTLYYKWSLTHLVSFFLLFRLLLFLLFLFYLICEVKTDKKHISTYANLVWSNLKRIKRLIDQVAQVMHTNKHIRSTRQTNKQTNRPSCIIFTS